MSFPGPDPPWCCIRPLAPGYCALLPRVQPWPSTASARLPRPPRTWPRRRRRWRRRRLPGCCRLLLSPPPRLPRCRPTTSRFSPRRSPDQLGPRTRGPILRTVTYQVRPSHCTELRYTETKMSPFWWNFCQRLHWKLCPQFPLQRAMKVSSYDNISVWLCLTTHNIMIR